MDLGPHIIKLIIIKDGLFLKYFVLFISLILSKFYYLKKNKTHDLNRHLSM